MRKSTEIKPKAKNSQALISTAFQDHITKQLNLDSLLTAKIPNKNYNKIQVSKVQSKVDTGLHKPKPDSTPKTSLTAEQEQREYVLNKPKSKADIPTLAEKFGLISTDNRRRSDLNEAEWSKVKEKYKEREDYKQPCVICKEQLGSQPQVLLSCTHTFHRTCLEVFERFSGKKCCPMCRKERYQTRVVYDASRYYKDLCASSCINHRIQAAWRGYLVRKWYKNYRRLVPPQNPALRRTFFEEKLSDITNRLVMSFNMNRDQMLADIDRNLAESRKAMRDFDLRFGREEIGEAKWCELFDKAMQRDHDECSICMNKYILPQGINQFGLNSNFTMLTQNFSSATLDDDDDAARKPVVLLSCSHVFHSVCLRTFEELNFDRLAVCPECRSAYKKKELCTL